MGPTCDIHSYFVLQSVLSLCSWTHTSRVFITGKTTLIIFPDLEYFRDTHIKEQSYLFYLNNRFQIQKKKSVDIDLNKF